MNNKIVWQKALPELPSVRFDATSTLGELQSYVIPEGYTKFRIECVAASGWSGHQGEFGKGGKVECTLNLMKKVNEKNILYVVVGVVPDASHKFGMMPEDMKWYPEYNASDVRTYNPTDNDNFPPFIPAEFYFDSTVKYPEDVLIPFEPYGTTGTLGTASLHSRIIVAGGGGCGNQYSAVTDIKQGSGDGGGLIGADGYGDMEYGRGGTQTEGGKQGGGFGIGTLCVDYGNPSAYGGAGWYSGGFAYVPAQGGSGGGGSSYTHPSYCTDVVHTQGYNTGDGYVIITPIG